MQLPFTDVREGDWFYDAVAYAYTNELFNGTSATTFSPNGTMTRAMLVTALCGWRRACGGWHIRFPGCEAGCVVHRGCGLGQPD